MAVKMNIGIDETDREAIAQGLDKLRRIPTVCICRLTTFTGT